MSVMVGKVRLLFSFPEESVFQTVIQILTHSPGAIEGRHAGAMATLCGLGLQEHTAPGTVIV